MASITFWTRLEPFTRLEDIELGLQAQIHDPLWMLARQWQTGEFQGEDSGSPVSARLRLERLPLARFHAGAANGQTSLPGQPYSADIPLEALVEREPVQQLSDPRRDLRLAAEAGLYFIRLLEKAGVPPAVRSAYVKENLYHLTGPLVDPAGSQDSAGAGYLAVMSGRAPDGLRLYEALNAALRPPQGGTPDLPPAPAVDPAQREKVIQVGLAYLDWFERRYSTPPSGPQTWNPERMEYAFQVSAPSGAGELALDAPEYPGGALDWYSFDLNPGLRLGVQPGDAQPETLSRTLLPSPLRFPGIAADRWWEFEDSSVNFSRIEGDPDELMRLLLVQFALVYSNDWFVMPVDLAPGALYRPKSLVVTDAFGERTLVPHYSAVDPAVRDWRVFANTSLPSTGFSSASRPPEDVFFLPPVLSSSLHGDPIEEVLVLRDELSNLVWAVERLVPGLAGDALNRAELYYRRETPPPPPATTALPNELRYLLATTTPEHWIPFLPVRIDPVLPDIRLRRAAALLDQGGAPALTRPLGRLLEPERPDLSLFEEEVPRSGLRLARRFQYTRWQDGATFLWLSRSKGAGKGESSAGLRYDQVDAV